MPTYVRAHVPGGTFFFTLVTYQRLPILAHPLARRALRNAIRRVRTERPFHIDAIVLLPDHLHTLWTLPDGDADFSTRWRLIKHWTTQQLTLQMVTLEQSASRQKKQERPIWQRRFWEHTVRNEDEFAALCDYIHYNQVKHGYVSCPHGWPYSSFWRSIKAGHYSWDWQCTCTGDESVKPLRDLTDDIVGE